MKYSNGSSDKRERRHHYETVMCTRSVMNVNSVVGCFYAAGPQTGVVLDISPRTAMCVRNVDVQMCPAVHTMTRS